MESFYSIQGEGYHSGKPAYFVRLAGCNVKCTWCDVKESWSIYENQFVKIEEIERESLGLKIGKSKEATASFLRYLSMVGF